MLTSLSIQNYAIISKTSIQFDNGLTIITGETGAGKSILMGALGLILGDRAESKVVLPGQEKCIIEASFNIDGYELSTFFETHELDYGSPCLVRRELTSNGKSRAFINDTPVNLQTLRALGIQLIDIVSQHQTLELNESAFQLGVLDAIAETETELIPYKKCYQKFKEAKQHLEKLIEQEQQSKEDEDYLRFVLNELAEASLQENEQEQLEEKLDALSHAEQIQQAAANTATILDGNEQSVIEQIREAKAMLNAAAKHLPAMKSLAERLESNLVDLKDIASELEQIAEKTMADPSALALVEERLQLLFHLQRKHKVGSNQELLALQEQFESRLNAIGNMEEQISLAKSELEKANKELAEAAKILSKKRSLAIKPAEEKVNALLLQVALPNASFQIHHEIKEQASLEGIDEISFLFSANKGFAPQPISKVASGGELSRLMLCLKSLIADKVKLPSIVFDEIDTGISGEAAQKVAQVMRNHAKAHQVIAITHLPQIAGKANKHLFVYKQVEGNATATHIKDLNPEERVEEIARMLSGENPSEKVLAAARELIS